MADAVVVAHVAGRAVMGWQSVAGPGSLPWQLEHADAHRAVVQPGRRHGLGAEPRSRWTKP